MKNIIKYIFIILLVTLVIMQFIRPEKNLGGYEGIANFNTDTNPSEEVFSILKTHCFDCHTDQTKYPWYAEIAPISYWLADHVNEGKDEFNMSNWDAYSVKKKDHKLEELIEELEEGKMPLSSYTWLHKNLEEKDKELLLQWAKMVKLQYQEELKMLFK